MASLFHFEEAFASVELGLAKSRAPRFEYLRSTRAVLWIRERRQRALTTKVMGALKTTPIESLAGCFAVLTDSKLRIKRR